MSECMGSKVIRFISEHCRTPEGEHVGKPIVLAEFQKKFLMDVYSNPHGTKTAYLSISRKNGKSALIAGILLAHIVGPAAVQNSQIVSGAMSRDQAALVFALASKMVQLSPVLSEMVKIVPSSKRLIGTLMNVEYRALAADGKTAHGLSPVLILIDELGQQRGPQSDFIDALVTSQGAHRNPLLIAISTQAATDADLFSIWLDDAQQSDDPHTVCHLYEAPRDCDLMDEEAWRVSNPALGIFRSYDDLKAQAERAVRMPSSESMFRNLILNQRVASFDTFVAPSVWKSCNAKPPDFGDAVVYGGLDLSAKTDLTSLVLVAKVGDKLAVRPYFWTPLNGLLDREKKDKAPYTQWEKEGLLFATPGSTVDYAYVAQHIGILTEGLTLGGIGFDRWRISFLEKELEREGISLPMEPHGQGFRDMGVSLDQLEEYLLNATLAHGDHPVLNMCAINAVAIRDPAENRKLEKKRSTGRIDGMVALAMAVGTMLRSGGQTVTSADIDNFLDSVEFI